MLQEETVQEVLARLARGEGIKTIARELGVDRKTIKQWRRLGQWRPRPCGVDPYRDRRFDQQRYQASGLNLVIAAIVLWSTVYLERVTQALKTHGQPVDDALLRYLSPLGWEHINLTGDYPWRQRRRIEQGRFRPLRPLTNP
jgi:hypothetical protein